MEGRYFGVALLLVLAFSAFGDAQDPLADKCQLAIDLSLVLDLSSSMLGVGNRPLFHLKNFVKQVVNTFQYSGVYKTQISLVSFNTDAIIHLDLDDCDDERCFMDAIDALPNPSGNTDINRPLNAVLNRVFTRAGGDRSVEDVVVIITDGHPSNIPIRPGYIEELRRRDFRAIVLAIGDAADDDAIYDIATSPFYDNVFFAESYELLMRIGENMRTLYCVTGVSTPIPRDAVPETCLYDIALLIDTSGSIIENPPYRHNWVLMRQFLRDFVKQIKNNYPNVHIALEDFRNRGNIRFNFQDCSNNTNIRCMDQIIRNMSIPWGNTRMAVAFQELREKVLGGPGNRPDVNDLVLFMTDGFPNPLTPNPRFEAQKIKDAGGRIVGIGVTQNVNVQIMEQIVSDPPSINYQGAKDYRALAEMTQRIIARTCSEGLQPCNLVADIAFLVDTSGSINEIEGGFDQLKRFLKRITDILDFSKTNVGMVSFATDASLRFDLDDCTDAACVKRRIDLLPNPGGFTNIGDAFTVTMSQIFGQSGDRSNAPNYIFLITDGTPTAQSIAGDQAIAQAKASGARIIVIGIGEEADSNFIYDIASLPFEENVFFAQDFSDLAVLVNYIRPLFCPDERPKTTLAPTTIAPLPEKCEIDIGMLVDVSGSITEYAPFHDNWVQLRNFMRTFIRNIKTTFPDVKIALETFANQGNVKFNFDGCNDNTDVDCMVNIVEGLNKPFGKTQMAVAFQVMRDEILASDANPSDAQDVVLFLTDGFPNPFTSDPRTIANEIKANGARIFGLAVTDRVNASIMQQVASPGDFLPVKSYRTLVTEITKIIRRSCVPITTTPSTKPCKSEGDVVFIVDGSGSVDVRNFNLVKEFMTDLVWNLDVSRNRVRIAVTEFSDFNTPIFDLDDYFTKQEIVNEIGLMKYSGRGTNTDVALRYVTDNFLTASRGDRPNKPNVCVVITDGSSSNGQRTLTQAERLKKKCHVIVIEVGGWVNEAEIYAMASHPAKDNVVKVKKFNALIAVKDRILDLICNNNVTCTRRQCENGGTPIEVQGNCFCSCPNGYVGERCPKLCPKPADIIAVVDKSGSIQQNDFREQLEFLKSLVVNLNFKMHRFGLVSFSDDADVDLQLGDVKDKHSAVNAINIWHEGGGTNTYRALQRVQNMFRTPRIVNGTKVMQIAIVMTDGKSQDQQKTFDEAVRLRNSGAYVIAVGVGNRYKKQELDGIASPPTSKNVIEVKSYSDLHSILSPLFDRICDRPCENFRCENGATPVEELDRCVCKCPPGTSGPKCERACKEQVDLALLVDASGSIRSERFPKVIDFICQVIGNITISENAAHAGAVTWSDSAKLQFDMNQYKSTHDVIQAVRKFQYVGGRTNTYNALNTARYSIFGRRGDRRDVDNHIIMFTDGGSNINVDRTVPEAEKLKQDGAVISIVAVGDDMNLVELNAVASDPTDKHILKARSHSQLAALIEDTYKLTCNDVDECADAPCQNGGTCADDVQTYWCACDSGFMGTQCQTACPRQQMDIALVLDVSGSVHIVYSVILSIAKKTVTMLNVDSGDVKVGLIKYSDRSTIIFDLDDHKTKRKMLNAISITKMEGTTNTQRAISSAHYSLLSGRRGDRGGVDNIMIVVTDGQSNVNKKMTYQEAERARSRGISIFVVAVGEVDIKEANEIANDPDPDYVVQIKTEADIDRGVDELLTKLCNSGT